MMAIPYLTLLPRALFIRSFEVIDGSLSRDLRRAEVIVRCGGSTHVLSARRTRSGWVVVNTLPSDCTVDVIKAVMEFAEELREMELEHRRITCIATGHCETPRYEVIHVIPGDP